MTRQILFIGDSDIAFWPKELLPCVQGDYPGWKEPLVSGHPGATLEGILPHLRKALSLTGNMVPKTLVVVACAGENDIGDGLSLETTERALNDFLDILFRANAEERFLLFLGPKFEPWLDDDLSSKNDYHKMTRTFERCLAEYQPNNGGVHFIDCLTMFCGETANIPGARFSGRAKAEERYFASDRLHLNKEGYQVWKDVIEEKIQTSLSL